MKIGHVAALVVLVPALAFGESAEDELKFAARLSARGHLEMASAHLKRLAASSDSSLARAGRYGLALLDRQRAVLLRNRFLNALKDGREPTVARADIEKLYAKAVDDVKSYVERAAKDLDARFQYGELLQEAGEFLAGWGYPDRLTAEQKKLREDNKDDIRKLFDTAVGEFDATLKGVRAQIRNPRDMTDAQESNLMRSEFSRAQASFRRALSMSSLALRTNGLEEAIELLDEFQGKYFNRIWGVYAIVFLGRAYRELGLERGSADDVETGLNYFDFLFGPDLNEDPEVPEKSQIMAEGFYWYADTCRIMALGPKAGPVAGRLKKARPAYWDKSIQAGSIMDRKLIAGAKLPSALRARLLIAEAHAARGDVKSAVAIVGYVLDTAKFSNLRAVMREASAKLTGWLAGAGGVRLDPGMLYQLGESETAQGRGAQAIAAFEKSIASATNDDDIERYAYPAWRKIAEVYRRSGRYYAASAAAMKVVNDYTKSTPKDENSRLGLAAGDSCNLARKCWKLISDNTKRAADAQEYKRISAIFRDEFPGHPENSDRAYREAREAEGDKKFLAAVELYKNISSSSPNYWTAQRRIPVCLRAMATRTKDPAARKGHEEACLAAALALTALGEKNPGVRGTESAKQYGALYAATSLAALERWEETITAMDKYLATYPKQYLFRGLELSVLTDAHIEMGQLDKAEATLAKMRAEMPTSAYMRSSSYGVYKALKGSYPKLEGEARIEMAARAALLWRERIDKDEKPKSAYYSVLGRIYIDAGKFQEAGDAYATAAEIEEQGENNPRLVAGYKLRAAGMQFRAAKATKESDPEEYLKRVAKTRELFMDVLVPDKAVQAKVFAALGSSSKYPQADTFKHVKKFVKPLLTAAEVLGESAPTGEFDGRWAGIRLIDYLHKFTAPAVDFTAPEKTQKLQKQYMKDWWDGFELKLRLCESIASGGSGAEKRRAARQGYAVWRKMKVEFPKMDGPDRVNTAAALGAKLKRQAGK